MNHRDVVFAVERTASAKVGDVAATMASQRTCPASCPFLDGGCYAMNGHMALMITKPLNRGTPAAMTAEQIAAIEARAIDSLSGLRPLRLHVVGDSPTYWGTVNLATAAESYTRRHGQPVWTYTHAWREIDRAAWGGVSVLASCETEGEVLAARARGYAAAIVVEHHGTARRHAMGQIDVLPCPEQTRGVQCVDCRLCMNDRRLLKSGITIGFAAHGGKRSIAKATATISRKQGVVSARNRHPDPVVRAARRRQCSIAWCGKARERWCATCAQPFCNVHQCDDHEVRQVAYSIPSNAAGLREEVPA